MLDQSEFERAYAEAKDLKVQSLREARSPTGGYFNIRLDAAWDGWRLAKTERVREALARGDANHE